MTIRVTQQFVQYVADPTTESDLRITRAFIQVPVSGADPLNQVVNQSLGWTAVATYDPVFNIFVSQRLFGGDGQTLTSNYFVAANTWFDNANSNVAGTDANEQIIQYLGWTDRFIAGPIGNTLGWNFGQRVAEAVIVVAANHWFTNPSFDNRVIRAYNAPNSLGWSNSVFAEIPLNVGNEFGLIDVAAITSDFDRGLVQTGFLKQSVSFTIDENKCREKEYDPLIGGGNENEFQDLATVAPTLTFQELVLSHPFDSPTLTLQLGNPEFGNVKIRNFTRIDRDTRGGTRKIFSDPKWAQWERLTMTITQIQCTETVDSIVDFLNATVGKKDVRLTDWEGQSWEGFIVEPQTDVTEEVDGHQLTLVYEGKVTDLNVQQGLLDVIQGFDGNGDPVQVVQND